MDDGFKIEDEIVTRRENETLDPENERSRIVLAFYCVLRIPLQLNNNNNNTSVYFKNKNKTHFSQIFILLLKIIINRFK
jgi:hypothetical protein